MHRRLVTATFLRDTIGLPTGTTYRLARLGLIPCYRTGLKMRGVRFCVEEVLAALRQPAKPDREAAHG
jgi:hypothetical protein